MLNFINESSETKIKQILKYRNINMQKWMCAVESTSIIFFESERINLFSNMKKEKIKIKIKKL